MWHVTRSLIELLSPRPPQPWWSPLNPTRISWEGDQPGYPGRSEWRFSLSPNHPNQDILGGWPTWASRAVWLVVFPLPQLPLPGYPGQVTNLGVQGGLIGRFLYPQSPQPGYPGRVTNLGVQGGLIGRFPYPQSPQPGYPGRVTNLGVQGGLIGRFLYPQSPQPGYPGQVTNLGIQGGLIGGFPSPPITLTRISWAGDQPGHPGRSD